MQEIDTQSFVAWLGSRSLADQKHAPHCARWVRRFLLSRGNAGGATSFATESTMSRAMTGWR